MCAASRFTSIPVVRYQRASRHSTIVWKSGAAWGYCMHPQMWSGWQVADTLEVHEARDLSFTRWRRRTEATARGGGAGREKVRLGGERTSSEGAEA